MLTLVLPLDALATATIDYQWTPPVGGSPVVRYDVEIDTDGQIVLTSTAGTENTFSVIYDFGETVAIRVRGVDAQGRTGPWSEWSDPYSDDGPPSGCGKPSFTVRY